MKIVLSPAVFVAILASASSVDDRATNSRLAPRDVYSSHETNMKTTFNLSGTYTGYYVCHSTLDGVPSTFNEVINVSISEMEDPTLPSNREAFFAELDYTAEKELGDQYTLYNGEYGVSLSGDIVHGYLNSCGGELVCLHVPCEIMTNTFTYAVCSSSELQPRFH